MAQKEYLKMADVFIGDVVAGDDDLIRDADGLIGDMQWPPDCAKYAAHAINSHDELVAEVERLRESNKRMALSIWSGWQKSGFFAGSYDNQAEIFKEQYLCDPIISKEAKE